MTLSVQFHVVFEYQDVTFNLGSVKVKYLAVYLSCIHWRPSSDSPQWLAEAVCRGSSHCTSVWQYFGWPMLWLAIACRVSVYFCQLKTTHTWGNDNSHALVLKVGTIHILILSETFGSISNSKFCISRFSKLGSNCQLSYFAAFWILNFLTLLRFTFWIPFVNFLTLPHCAFWITFANLFTLLHFGFWILDFNCLTLLHFTSWISIYKTHFEWLRASYEYSHFDR